MNGNTLYSLAGRCLVFGTRLAGTSAAVRIPTCQTLNNMLTCCCFTPTGVFRQACDRRRHCNSQPGANRDCVQETCPNFLLYHFLEDLHNGSVQNGSVSYSGAATTLRGCCSYCWRASGCCCCTYTAGWHCTRKLLSLDCHCPAGESLPNPATLCKLHLLAHYCTLMRPARTSCICSTLPINLANLAGEKSDAS